MRVDAPRSMRSQKNAASLWAALHRAHRGKTTGSTTAGPVVGSDRTRRLPLAVRCALL